MPVDVKELFDNRTEVRTTFRNRVLIHTFAFPDRTKWLEYQRRASNFRLRNRKFAATDEAAGVRLWVYDQWCEKVEVEDKVGDVVNRVDVADFKTQVPVMVKDQAAVAFLSQVETEEEEEKNF